MDPCTYFNLNCVDDSWRTCLKQSLAAIEVPYLAQLFQTGQWLPGPHKIFNAFSLPLDQVNYVLFGESPYPRAQSANGYAFWDAAVKNLWSDSGLSKEVNRATSLRNIIKMLLIAEGCLSPSHTSQADIASIDKSQFVQTNEAFFQNFLAQGFLLLNATPVLQAGPPQKDAKAWYPFIKILLHCLLEKNPDVTFVLFGQIANKIIPLIPTQHLNKLQAEHPYNISFITNPNVISFFKPLHLLRKK